MIKATAGGGGRGIRKVDDAAGLAEAFTSACAEGLKSFGDATVFMERVVTDARHVEVQIIADGHGTVWAVGVRDCTMQRRNQKVIEESHCVALTAEQDRDLRAAAVRLAAAAGYPNAGTVEFLLPTGGAAFAFLEVNTRLQVEHPVTELTTGLDLVKLQIHVAGGGRLEGDAPPTFGYAIEARLNAEDPAARVRPGAGRRSRRCRCPSGPGSGSTPASAEGDVIPPEYDSMIAKIIASGRDRDEALGPAAPGARPDDRAGRAAARRTSRSCSTCSIGPRCIAGADRHGLARPAHRGRRPPAHTPRRRRARRRRARRRRAAGRRRPGHLPRVGESRPPAGRRSTSGTTSSCDKAPSRTWSVSDPSGRPASRSRSTASRRSSTSNGSGESRSRLTIGRTAFGIVSTTQDSDQLVEVDGVAHRFSRDDAGVVRAPSSALVVGVDVAVDDVVEVGQRLAVIEAMKMEMAVPAPIRGRVRDVFVSRNVQVLAGAPLFRLEADDVDGGATPGTEQRTIDLDAFAGAATASADEIVRAFVLGFDVDPARAREQVDSDSITERAAPGDPRRVRRPVRALARAPGHRR